MAKIYGYGPTRSMKCVWMARELGTQIEEVTLKWNTEKGGFGDDSYRQLNPFGLIPTMQDDDLTLFESQAIINYLGEQRPEKGLVPKAGTKERALYDQWTFFCVGTLEQPMSSWFRHSYIFEDAVKNPQERDRAGRELQQKLAILDALVGDREHLVGNTFTAADITMTYTLGWIHSCELLEQHTHLMAYMKRHMARPNYPRELYR